LIADQKITQKDAADFLGISQSKMTALRNGRLQNFTIDHLVSLFRRMNSGLQKLQGQ
jgi:predicted XRE-type DNA-binding protein